MPTKRTRIARSPVGVDAAQLAQYFRLLNDEPLLGGDGNDILAYTFEHNLRGFREHLWSQYGGQIVAEWSVTRPGRRPSTWWDFSAPRQPLGRWPDCYWDGNLPEPRARVGGRGTPCHECLAYTPIYELGLPRYWASHFDYDYYTGSARDVQGKPIGQEYVGNHFRAERFDPKNPPLFESQARYLKRLGLLLPGESRRLRAADFDNEPLPEDFWPALDGDR